MNISLPQKECEKNGQDSVMLVRNPRLANMTMNLESLNLYFTGSLHSTGKDVYCSVSGGFSSPRISTLHVPACYRM